MTAVAEQAIRSAETDIGLAIVVHDLHQQLWSRLPSRRFCHHHPACRRIKEGVHGGRCVRFEVEDFRQEAAAWRDGRLHRCHAGLVELAMPIFIGKTLLLVLFAGPARLADHAQLDWLAESDTPVPCGHSAVPELAVERIADCRERLLQLGARLRCLIADAPLDEAPDNERPRRHRIEAFIANHHAEALRLADLAHLLGLGLERSRHVVREECGVGFAELVKQTRIRSARSLLLNTDLPVATVGERCGLPDPSGFTRTFKEVEGCSPGRWRRRYQA